MDHKRRGLLTEKASSFMSGGYLIILTLNSVTVENFYTDVSEL
jgi:hypothetical protein